MARGPDLVSRARLLQPGFDAARSSYGLGALPGDTSFAPDRQYIFNFVVDDLDQALSQAEEGGARREGEIAEYDYGRFGWFIDPEGNKVELWQPN